MTDTTRRSGAQHALVERLKRMIEERYDEPLTLTSLASAIQRDRAHVATIFRQRTGQTVHRYLTTVRVARARQLIREGEKVEVAMLLVGYRSKKNFYRQFRTHTGVTPGAYRALARVHRPAAPS